MTTLAEAFETFAAGANVAVNYQLYISHTNMTGNPISSANSVTFLDDGLSYEDTVNVVHFVPNDQLLELFFNPITPTVEASADDSADSSDDSSDPTD